MTVCQQCKVYCHIILTAAAFPGLHCTVLICTICLRELEELGMPPHTKLSIVA